MFCFSAGTLSPLSRYSPERSSRRRQRSSRDRDESEERRRKRDRDQRKKDRSRDRRDASAERRERNRSPVRYLSPKRDKKEAKIRRYRVQVPKVSLNM